MTRVRKNSAEMPATRTMTVEELLKSGLVGIWKTRTDIDENLKFARELREKAWTHKDDDNDSR
ncbi:MAG: hypothetical protein KKB51_11785 [Candidatus Riflebacteria bacterium]|nr:hypothetical protein [Candidatus Riflebacteria bacterium]